MYFLAWDKNFCWDKKYFVQLDGQGIRVIGYADSSYFGCSCILTYVHTLQFLKRIDSVGLKVRDFKENEKICSAIIRVTKSFMLVYATLTTNKQRQL